MNKITFFNTLIENSYIN